LIFCYLLYQDKSSSPRGNERLRATLTPCNIRPVQSGIASFFAMTLEELSSPTNHNDNPPYQNDSIIGVKHTLRLSNINLYY